MISDNLVKNFSNGFRKVLIFIISFLTGLNAITIVLQVLMRYFLRKSIAWTNELAGISLVWITFLGATLITADESHIGMDMIIEKLKPLPRLILKLIINFFILVVCLILVKHGYGTVMKGFNSKLISLPGNLGIVVSVIPISGVLMAITSISNSLRDIKAFRNDETVGEDSGSMDTLYSDVPDEVLNRSMEAFEESDDSSGESDDKNGGGNE